jgi:anaerobic magnesium-protoporphyrin IX monomethyl ester cyclase
MTKARILFIQKEFVPLGVQYMSALLKKHGYEVKVLTFNDPLANFSFNEKGRARALESFKQTAVDKIREYSPNIIGFSAFTMNFRWSVDIAEHIKKHCPIPIIFGGYHVSMVPEKAIQETAIDMIAIGECETMILDLMRALEHGGSLTGISNLWVKEGGVVHKNPIAPLITDLNAIPFPDTDLCPPSHQYGASYLIMGSRGCPYRCAYCSNNYYISLYKNWSKVRFRSVDNIMAEIGQATHRFPGIKRIDFCDDVIATDNERIEQLFSALQKQFNLSYSVYLHPNLINEKTIEILKKTGCNLLKIGVQTPDQHNRKEYLKRTDTNAKIESIAEWSHRHGLKFSFDHIYAFPFDTRENLIESVKFYNKTRPYLIRYSKLSYLPNTAIIQVALDKGVLHPDEVDVIERGDHVSSSFYNVALLLQKTKPGQDLAVLQNRVLYLYALLSYRSQAHIDKLLNRGFLEKDQPIHPLSMMMAKTLATFRAGQISVYWAVIKGVFLIPFAKPYYFR